MKLRAHYIFYRKHNMMIAVSSIIVILSMAGAAVVAEEKTCSSFCSSLGMLQSSPGKSCAEIYQVNKASRGVSGLYWINTTSGLHQVTCDMELECGGHKGGWTTIAKFDTSKGGPCPSGWTKITTRGASPKSVCRSGGNAGCDSTIFSTYDITFNKICGQVKGYQKASPDAFWAKYATKSINAQYVDGLSITLGNPRKHVWTYAAGLSDDGNYTSENCPCAASPGLDPPAFVGNHYYCESGDTGIHQTGEFYYTSDVLWDGDGCHDDKNNCCTNPDMPWFFRQFTSNMYDYLEARICKDQSFHDEDTLVESIELYVQ